MNKLFVPFILLLFTFSSYAQNGDNYLTHYEPSISGLDNDNHAIAQDKYGQMAFANRKGVLKFDGSNWYLIPTPTSSFSLAYLEDNSRLYVGCKEGFGYIKYDAMGREKYISLSDSLDLNEDIIHIETSKDKVYFQGELGVYCYSASEEKLIAVWHPETNRNYYSIFKIDEQLYVFTEESEIYKVEGTDLVKDSLHIPNDEAPVFVLPFTESVSIVGTQEGNLYKLRGKSFSSIHLEDQAYVSSGELLNGVLLKDEKIILSTIKGGCLIVELDSGKTEDFINYQSGLPDDEILAIAKDRSGGIWIAHEFGLSRADYHLPIKNYSNYPGLEGNINAAHTFSGKLYVATNLGVYYLDEVKNYREIEKLVKVRHRRSRSVTSSIRSKVKKVKKEINKPFQFLKNKKKNPVTEKKENTTDNEQNEKKLSKKDQRKARKEKRKQLRNRKKTVNTGILSKKGLDKKNKEEKKGNKEKEQSAKPKKKKVYYYVTKTHTETELALQSIKHLFKEVDSLDAKCTQFAKFNDKLLVASNNGIYEIRGDSAVRISEESINYLYASRFQSKIYASTDENKIIEFNYRDEGWSRDSTFIAFDDLVNHIGEDDHKNLWFCGVNSIYRYQLNDSGNILSENHIPISNPYSDEIFMLNAGGREYFALSKGLYYYDSIQNSLVNDTITAKELGFKSVYLHSQSDILWVHDGKSWQFLSDDITYNDNFLFLRLFKNLKEILLSEDKKYFWVISDKGHLYKFDISSKQENLHDYDIFLKSVNRKNGDFISVQEFKLSQLASDVSFTIIHPEYIDKNSLEYQYRLIGLNDKWSEWSNKNVVSFNLLPPGKYKLEVKGRNAFGETFEGTLINFKVKPPYWQEAWFYGLEVFFFGSLLFFSFRLNRARRANRIITKGLTYFTLILIVELINTVAQAYFQVGNSPVLNFLVQAGIAILIFPFEKVLSKFLVRKEEAG